MNLELSEVSVPPRIQNVTQNTLVQRQFSGYLPCMLHIMLYTCSLSLLLLPVGSILEWVGCYLMTAVGLGVFMFLSL